VRYYAEIKKENLVPKKGSILTHILKHRNTVIYLSPCSGLGANNSVGVDNGIPII